MVLLPRAGTVVTALARVLRTVTRMSALAGRDRGKHGGARGAVGLVPGLVWRDPEEGHALTRDLTDHRGGDHAAVLALARVPGGDQDGQARLLGRDQPDERRHVSIAVMAVLCDLGRSCL